MHLVFTDVIFQQLKQCANSSISEFPFVQSFYSRYMIILVQNMCVTIET